MRFWGLLYSLNLYILNLNAMFINCHSYNLDGPEEAFWNIESINMAHVHEKLTQSVLMKKAQTLEEMLPPPDFKGCSKGF